MLDLKMLITHEYSLENALDAFNLCADISKGSIKVQIVDEKEIFLQ